MNNIVSHEDFEAMVKPLEKRIYLYLKKLCKEGFSAQDVMQETLITAYHKHQTVKDQTKFASWLYRVGINHCNMYKRKLKPIHEESEKVILLTPDNNSNPADIFDQKDFAHKLETALHKLPEKYRIVLILKDIEGYKSKEISEKTGLSLANVKAISLRARKKLQQGLL
ncbi:MAG: RNA polymerase sigma factor [Candidatus Riflemargulisbacteria bacterium]